MFIARTMIAIGLLAVSIVVAAHFILTPFYQNTMDIGLMWDILNWFMAVAAIIALIVNYHRFQVTDGQSGDGPVTRQYLQVNVALFASILLVIWILWNWFDNLTIGVRFAVGHPPDLCGRSSTRCSYSLRVPRDSTCGDLVVPNSLHHFGHDGCALSVGFV